MRFIRLFAGPLMIVCGVLAAGMAIAAAEFPFDQELVLEAAPMRPGKRMPTINVASDGNARVDLWCKTVPARVEISDAAIKIEPGPLPDELPQMQGNGQCTPERMAADGPLLEKLSGATTWQREGGAIVLNGAARLKFAAPSN